MSGTKPNYSQQIPANCQRGTRSYVSAGRPFAMTDINPRAMDSSCGTNTESTIPGLSQSCKNEYISKGRPFNPLIDISGNRSDRISHRFRCVECIQPCQKDDCLRLQHEMVKNKDFALCHLRAEQSLACVNSPNACPRYESSARTAGSSRGRAFDYTGEVQRQQNQEEHLRKKKHNSKIFPKSERGNVMAGRPVDLDRVCDYNLPAKSATNAKGRSYDLQRDVTFRRLNLPTPKQQQRARSCPTPVQRETLHVSQQRVPRVCPRPSQSTVSPNRSSSEFPESRYGTPMQQTQTRSPAVRTKYSDDPSNSSGIATMNATTNHPKSRDKSLNQCDNLAERQEHLRNNNNGTQCDSIEMDSSYGRTPPRGLMRSPLKTPATLGPSSLRLTSTQENMLTQGTSMAKTTKPQSARLCPLDRSDEYNSVNQTKHSSIRNNTTTKCFEDSSFYNAVSPMEPRFSQSGNMPPDKSYYYNVSMFDEPRQLSQRQPECIEKSYIDLTDDTQYICDDMDISAPHLLSRSTIPIRNDDSRQMHSWTIPEEDITGYNRCPGDESRNQHLDRARYVGNATSRNGTMGADFDVTEYQELPSRLVNFPFTCPPCEQPKAIPEKSSGCITSPIEQTAGQMYNTTSLGLSQLFNTARAQNESLGSRDLYATQCNNATTLGLSALFDNQSNLMNDSVSVRECANAKRCGRVQFDSSDYYEDPTRTDIRKAEIENLVNDTYCPGIIQETIDGQKNFNDHSFNICLSKKPKDVCNGEGQPTDDPMTLLEAFAIRVQRTREQINAEHKENLTTEQIEDSIQQYFDTQNPSDLNRSIKNLLLSERLHDHDQVEKSKGTILEAEVQKLVTTLPDNAKVKLIAYTGHTKPTNQETIE